MQSPARRTVAWRWKSGCSCGGRGETRVFDYNEKVYSAPVLPWLNVRVYELSGE